MNVFGRGRGEGGRACDAQGTEDRGAVAEPSCGTQGQRKSRSLRAMLRDGDQTHTGRGTFVRYTGGGASRGNFVRCSGTETRQRAVAESSCDTQGREPASRGTFVRCSRAYEKQRLRQVSDVLVSLLMRNKTPAASLQCFFEFGMRNKTHAGNNRGGV